MPSFSKLLRPKEGKEKSEAKSPKPPNSPKSPETGKTPRFSKTHKNNDHLNQCEGCYNVEGMIRSNLNPGSNRVERAILHHSFEDLENCSHNCQICRMFRQALVLAEVTFDGVKELQKTPGAIIVHWGESPTTEGTPKPFLNVEHKGLKNLPERFGVLNCSKDAEVAQLALSSDGLNHAVIQQAKDWLDTCRNTHIGQCDNLKWSSENPRLLIEILSSSSIRLCENQKGGDYVALSYCWGMGALSEAEQGVVLRGRTLKENLNERRREFSIREFPGTVRDALHIIHAIGIRYAWVDSICIVQDDIDPATEKPKGVETMHLVYSNALFTLCSCATNYATASMLSKREAWTLQTEPCRLGTQWLTTPDMSLTELRLRSPLAGRAWTLQEERLSPRMLYVSSNTMHWSCAVDDMLELKPMRAQKAATVPRPVYAATDRKAQLPSPQEFLLECYAGSTDLHFFWADIVKSYVKRGMGFPSDRLTALSGIAAKYLSSSSGDEYLAGLWANHLAEGLAWRVQQAIQPDTNNKDLMNVLNSMPSWSWAKIPPASDIDTDAGSKTSSAFQRVIDDDHPRAASRPSLDNAIQRGEKVKELRVAGHTRQLWGRSSRRVDWSSISKMVNNEEKFTFAISPELDMHAVDSQTGRVVVYEERKKEVIGHIDLRLDVEIMQSDQMDLKALELGVSTALLLQYSGGGKWRRVGVAWGVRGDFFASANRETLILC